MTGALIELMAKHLPPSGSTLRLLDIDGAAGQLLAAQRPDISVQTAPAEAATWTLPDNSVDAITVYGRQLTPHLLTLALRALRPGGRMIAVDPSGAIDRAHVDALESAGFTRILVEAVSESPLGVLMRGEKPHVTGDTLARIRVAAQSDDLLTDLSSYPGRYLYLLIRQAPNKPVWALKEGEKLHWQAVTLESQMLPRPVLIAFSSLAKAVAFMQPAILAGHMRDINKVGKFRVETVRTWSLAVKLNPDVTILSHAWSFVAVDPASAEHADE